MDYIHYVQHVLSSDVVACSMTNLPVCQRIVTWSAAPADQYDNGQNLKSLAIEGGSHSR